MADWFDVRHGDLIQVKGYAPFTVGSIEIFEPPESVAVVETRDGLRKTFPLTVPVEVIDRLREFPIEGDSGGNT